MNERILKSINIYRSNIGKLEQIIKIIVDNEIKELLPIAEKLKLVLEILKKIVKILEKISDFQRQIASFADLDEDTRRNWTYKIGKIKTNYNDFLKKSRKISIDAYVYCDIDFYFSYTHKLLIIKKMIFFNSSRVTLVKNEYDKNDILNLILNE